MGTVGAQQSGLSGAQQGVALRAAVQSSVMASAAPERISTAQQVLDELTQAVEQCSGERPGVSSGQIAQGVMRGLSAQAAAEQANTPSQRSFQLRGGFPSGLSDLRANLKQACSSFNGGNWMVEIYTEGRSYVAVAWRRLVPMWLLAPGGNERAEQETLEALNRARQSGGHCAETSFGPSAPLVIDHRLSRVVDQYVHLQAGRSLTGHTGPDGSTPASRTSAQDVPWTLLGENLAYGTSTPEETVAALLKSPGHCRNILNPEFTRVGLAWAIGGQWGLTWGELFAR